MNRSDAPGASSWLERVLERLVEAAHPLVEPARSLLAPLDAFLSDLPLAAGRWCAAAFFLSAAVVVLFLKRETVYEGAPDRAWWRDLRLWSVLALLPYVIIYLFFFLPR